jgi:hypothetical protein
VLSRHFEASHVPARLPDVLPDDWRGAFVLLVIVFVLSSFLDNIAAALIGGTVARTVFRGKVHIGYVAAMVAAANAGGSGSVVGDTTTTMMWIDGVSPFDVLHAYVAAGVALLVFGIPAAAAATGVVADPAPRTARVPIDWARSRCRRMDPRARGRRQRRGQRAVSSSGRSIAAARARCLGGTARRPAREATGLERAARGLSRHCVPAVSRARCVDDAGRAPAAGLVAHGFRPGVRVGTWFDNIPLTKLALVQGGYDWGGLAYTVGFGGSMIWFGSSAGVADHEHVSGGALGRRVAQVRLAHRGRLHRGFRGIPRDRRLASACTAPPEHAAMRGVA